MVRREQNEVVEAIDLCKRALELSPRDGEVHLTLGEIYAQRLDYAAGAIAEALASGIEDRQYSLGNVPKGAVVGYVGDELNRSGRKDLAEAVETGDLLLCALSALR